MARESDIDFRQIALLVAVTAIGAILTWSATRETIRSAEEEARAKFESTAALYVNRIKSELDHGLDASEDLYRYYEAYEGFDAATFERMVSSSSGLNRNRKLVGVVIAVGESNQDSFMRYARSKYSGEFDMKAPAKVPDPAPAKARKFPFLYAWSSDLRRQGRWTGMDLGAHASLNAFFEETLRTGKPGGILLPQLETTDEGCVLLAVPFRRSRENAAGLVIQLIDLPQMVRFALETDRLAGLNASFNSHWADGRYEQALKIVDWKLSDEAPPPPALRPWASTQEMQVGSYTWEVTPWSHYIGFKIDYGAAVITAGVSMILTGLVIFIVWSQSQRAKRVVDIVNRRTRALKEAHEELEQHYKLLQNLNKDVEEARKSAETANRAKSEFLATMSHELRTPLNAILGFSQLLQEQALGPIGDKRYVDYAKDIHSSGSHLLAIINDILDLAKLEAGKIRIEHKVLSSRLLVERAVALLQQQATGKGIKLSAEFAPGMPDRIYGDELRLRQILINLASNSLKFTNQGGVVIRLHPKAFPTGQPGWVLEVEDTGIGIPEEKQATLFDRFTQVDTALSRRHGGVGLGLAICRELVDRMEGKISVRSTPGVGTTMRVHLPLEEVDGDDDDDGMI
ncbi:ATP-binding protein [Kordiimonas gwangyangensis]|uniref:sensor histidine kinase n=2 Tax=Kordiimonas gwangyangensis TaxID=288022 RepID=UPI0003753B20|nr:ATP-binding protein [Kordiimonas gwangyangensis]